MPLAAISKKGWDAVVASNLTGGFLMARETYTQWMQKNGGAIVNMIADMWGGMPGMGHSGAARAGMLNFTETAAIERSEEHTSELQSLMRISYAVFCLKKNNEHRNNN